MDEDTAWTSVLQAMHFIIQYCQDSMTTEQPTADRFKAVFRAISARVAALIREREDHKDITVTDENLIQDLRFGVRKLRQDNRELRGRSGINSAIERHVMWLMERKDMRVERNQLKLLVHQRGNTIKALQVWLDGKRRKVLALERQLQRLSHLTTYKPDESKDPQMEEVKSVALG